VFSHRLSLSRGTFALPAGSPHDRNGSLLASTRATIPRPGPPCLYPYSLCFRISTPSTAERSTFAIKRSKSSLLPRERFLFIIVSKAGIALTLPADWPLLAVIATRDPETETTAVHSSTTRSSAHSRRLISLYSLTKHLPHSMPLNYLTRSSRASVSQHSLKRALLSTHSPRHVQSNSTALQTRSTASVPPYFPYRRNMAPHADAPNESNTTSLPTANSQHAHHSPATRHVHPSP
jgi:hypothetical protein